MAWKPLASRDFHQESLAVDGKKFPIRRGQRASSPNLRRIILENNFYHFGIWCILILDGRVKVGSINLLGDERVLMHGRESGNMAYIYKIINDINDKVYIGQTTRSLSKRWSQHKQDSKEGQTHLYRAMRKYGIEHFSIEQIVECSENELDKLERFYIEQYDSYENGYNSTLSGQYECGIRGSQDFTKTELEDMWNQGLGVKEISEQLNVHKRTISHWLEEYEIATHEEKENRGKSKSREGSKRYSNIAVFFNGVKYDSITDLAEVIQKEYFPEKRLKTIMQGISNASKTGKSYCGLFFERE